MNTWITTPQMRVWLDVSWEQLAFIAALFKKDNESGKDGWIKLRNSEIQYWTGLKGKESIAKCKKVLESRNYIEIQSKTGERYKIGYKLRSALLDQPSWRLLYKGYSSWKEFETSSETEQELVRKPNKASSETEQDTIYNIYTTTNTEKLFENFFLKFPEAKRETVMAKVQEIENQCARVEVPFDWGNSTVRLRRFFFVYSFSFLLKKLGDMLSWVEDNRKKASAQRLETFIRRDLERMSEADRNRCAPGLASDEIDTRERVESAVKYTKTTGVEVKDSTLREEQGSQVTDLTALSLDEICAKVASNSN